MDSPIEAALTVAANYGVSCPKASVVSQGRSVVARLFPSSIIVKIIPDSADEVLLAELEKEVLLSADLAKIGAPVVPPASELPEGLHSHGGYRMAFWAFCPPLPEKDFYSGDVVRSLSELHKALIAYAGQLPHLGDYVEMCNRALETDSRLRKRAGPDDTRFLEHISRNLDERSASVSSEAIPLHGDVYPGNLMCCRDRLLWTDFEGACVGPKEWDYEIFPDQILASHPQELDSQILRLMRELKSYCVIIWCLSKKALMAKDRDVIRYHINTLRRKGMVR
jgi:hypothetical protein